MGAYYRAFKRGDFDLVIGSWIGFTGPDFFFIPFFIASQFLQKEETVDGTKVKKWIGYLVMR